MTSSDAALRGSTGRDLQMQGARLRAPASKQPGPSGGHNRLACAAEIASDLLARLHRCYTARACARWARGSLSFSCCSPVWAAHPLQCRRPQGQPQCPGSGWYRRPSATVFESYSLRRAPWCPTPCHASHGGAPQPTRHCQPRRGRYALVLGRSLAPITVSTLPVR
jgi:hypothetical protein